MPTSDLHSSTILGPTATRFSRWCLVLSQSCSVLALRGWSAWWLSASNRSWMSVRKSPARHGRLDAELPCERWPGTFVAKFPQDRARAALESGWVCVRFARRAGGPCLQSVADALLPGSIRRSLLAGHLRSRSLREEDQCPHVDQWSVGGPMGGIGGNSCL